MEVWIIEIGEPIPEVDGNFRYFRAGLLANALVSKGHQVTWWASDFNHLDKKRRFLPARSIELQPGLLVRFLHGCGYNRSFSLKRFFHHRITARNFSKDAAKAAKADLIFCCLPTLELSEKAVAFGEKAGIPVIIDIRDQWPDHYLTLVPKRLRGIFRFGLGSEFRRVQRVLKGASGITAISKTYLEWGLKNACRTQQTFDGIFPMGYPESTEALEEEVKKRRSQLVSKYKITPNDLILTFVGTFCSSYAVETVIEAARFFHEQGQKHIKFIIVGEGDNGMKLRKQCQGLSNIVFTGWFDQTSLQAVLSLSSVGLAPYSENASMSLPNKPFEYFASSLPIISSLRGELEALILRENIGIQYQSSDVFSLIESILWFSKHTDDRKLMGLKAGKLFEKKYSAEVVFGKLISHFENVVSHSSGRVFNK